MRRKTTAAYGPPTYKVGKGRPPLNSRWKKGQSGNPKGRPKGSKNADTIVTAIMNKKIPYAQNGKMRKATTREAIFTVMTQRALKGDHKSAHYLISLDAEIQRKAPPTRQAEVDLKSLSRKEREKRAQEAYLYLIKG